MANPVQRVNLEIQMLKSQSTNTHEYQIQIMLEMFYFI